MAENMIDSLWEATYADAAHGFAGPEAIKRAFMLRDGEISSDYQAETAQHDVKYVFENEHSTRVVHFADGYCLTLPFTGVSIDDALGALKTVYAGDGYRLTVSYEDRSTYGNTPEGWHIYLTEWLNRYIHDDGFLEKNGLERRSPTVERTDILPGYTVTVYHIAIGGGIQVELPCYHIAILRKTNCYNAFYLLNLKTADDGAALFDTILNSFRPITRQGCGKNTVGTYPLCIPDDWSEETRAYYDSLFDKIDRGNMDWGVFTASLPDRNEDAFAAVRERVIDTLSWMQGEEGMGCAMQIFPTYLHLGYMDKMLYFPMELATEFAGGNGFNGKPVLQLSYQFTTTNNTGLEGKTPIYDILRGVYDEHFRELARDIRTYGKPVLFRLNNEMNTDWTSYCGMVSLLDPELYIASWRRLYDIFRQEDVDNTIWIFNPMAKSCPYSRWGDTLCYVPGPEYVHVLGLTYYEFGNGDLRSFSDMYTELYEMNMPYFRGWPMIAGEFGCGAGGENKGLALGRNRENRVRWLKDMFDCLAKKTEPGYEYCRQIAGMIWFNVNDYDGKLISNLLKIDREESDAWANIREGLAKLNPPSGKG